MDPISVVDLRDLYGLVGVPVVVALVEVVKRTLPQLDGRWYPLLALALGVLWNLGVGHALDVDPLLSVFVGVIVGLAASGLYSQAKTISARSTEVP